MSYYDSFSSQYQGTPLAVIYYTCPWTVTPGAKDQLDVSLTAEIEGVGLVSFFLSPSSRISSPRFIYMQIYAIPNTQFPIISP